VFSANPGLLSCLLDAGGDVRLHDLEGRVPADWLMTDTQEHGGVCEVCGEGMRMNTGERKCHDNYSVNRWFKSAAAVKVNAS